jgi:uncharacterized protein
MPTAKVAPPRSSALRKIIVGFCAVLVLVYLAAGAFFFFQQDQMTFPAPKEYAPATPTDVGITYEDLHIPVNGSEQIHAWWVPAAPASDKVLLFFHGNGYVLDQTVGDRGELTPLHNLGANLLMVDYRGYGTSSPITPNETRVYEDARRAFTYLTQQRSVPPHDIIFIGRSIGTGPATEMAREHPDAGGLILISPFTSIPDAAQAIWYLRAFPLTLFSHNQFKNLSKMDSVRVPVLIAVGKEDQLTPPWMAQALFQKANQPKRLYLTPGAEHNDIFKVGGQGLETQISDFLQTL